MEQKQKTKALKDFSDLTAAKNKSLTVWFCFKLFKTLYANQRVLKFILRDVSRLGDVLRSRVM